MGAYIIRRLLQAIPTLFFVSIIIFGIMRLTPGDPARALLGNQYGITPEMVETVREEMGLNRPLYVQYLSWLTGILQGDFGRSYINRTDVSTLIQMRLPASIQLAVAAISFALVVAIPAGIISAVKRGSWIDHLVTTFVTAGLAMPGFWLAMLVVLLFAVALRWLPPSGYVAFDRDPQANLRLLILPSITLAILIASPTMRFLRSSMLDVLGEDFMRVARAKGLVEQAVIFRHALRNALIPTVTWVGLEFATIVGNSVMVEWVFGWPGIGFLTVQSVMNRDYLAVQGTVMVVAAIFVMVNLAVDLLYVYLDPRVRLS
ncbi:MAG: ABC transporter permease [Chloroflexi bacterium]|nr:ABC transporter permease [Chloroflexota bacterium]